MKMATLYISDDLSKHNANIFRKPMTRKSTKIPKHIYEIPKQFKEILQKVPCRIFGKVLDFLRFWTGPKTA